MTLFVCIFVCSCHYLKLLVTSCSSVLDTLLSSTSNWSNMQYHYDVVLSLIAVQPFDIKTNLIGTTFNTLFCAESGRPIPLDIDRGLAPDVRNSVMFKHGYPTADLMAQ